MKKINEIFLSLQGEGMHSGEAAVFVRFSGCNLRCPFCDTDHREGRMMTDDEIVAEIEKHPATTVIFTGGEPALQLDSDLCQRLRNSGHRIAVETNGTHQIPVGVDWVTLSPKFAYCDNAHLHPSIGQVEELKVVFDEDTDMGLYEDIPAMFRFIQPCDTGDESRNQKITKRAMEYCLAHPQWRLSLQLQKILKIR